MKRESKKSCNVFVSAVLVAFVLMFVSFVSASAYLSQPQPTYNLGDSVELNLTVDPVESGPLKIKLTCSGQSVDIFSGPVIDSIEIPLNSMWIGNLSGNCYFTTYYAGEERNTNPDFLISNRLNVYLSISSFFANPGDEVIINGNAKKLNGNNVNGEVEISLPFSGASQIGVLENSSNVTVVDNVNVEKFYGRISNGEFSVGIVLPSNIAANTYKINVLAYENSDSVQKVNQGSVESTLKVSQVLSSIDVAVDNQNYNPGDNISIKPVLLDQTGGQISEQVSVIVTDENFERVFEKIVNSGEVAVFNSPTDLSSGYYTADVSSGDINVTKIFFINEKAIVFFEIINGTLIVTNVGNIEYKKDIQVEINGRPFVKSLDLALGEVAEFKLTGQDGVYDVKVSDGETTMDQKGIALTGFSIDVKDSSDSGIMNSKYKTIIWIILIVFLLGGLLFFSANVVKRRSYAYPSNSFNEKKVLKLDRMVKTERQEFKKTESEEKPEPRRISMSDLRVIVPRQAEQALVVRGEKQMSTILVVKIKNKIATYSKEILENIIEQVYQKKGAICEQGDFIIVVFSPLVTKTFKNEVEVARMAGKICSDIKEHNSKFKDIIEFGIGINTGEIINELRAGKLMFTALGSSVLTAKKLADMSNMQVLTTKETYERGISEIKADRKIINGADVYEIRSVVDYEKNKKFVDDFLKKQEKDKSVALGFAPQRSYGYNSGIANKVSINSGDIKKDEKFTIAKDDFTSLHPGLRSPHTEHK